MRINNFGAGPYQKLFVHASDIVYTKGGVLGSTLVPAFPSRGTNIHASATRAGFSKMNALILNAIHCASNTLYFQCILQSAACMQDNFHNHLLVILGLQVTELFFDSIARVQDSKFIRLVSRTRRRGPLGKGLQKMQRRKINAHTKSRWCGATLQILTWTGAWNIFEKSTRLSTLGDVAPTNASSYKMGCRRIIKDKENPKLDKLYTQLISYIQ